MNQFLSHTTRKNNERRFTGSARGRESVTPISTQERVQFPLHRALWRDSQELINFQEKMVRSHIPQ